MIELLRILFYYPFVNILTFFTWLIPGHNVAWGIILLTLLVRFALLIPSRKSAESQRKIAQLNPLIEELKKEYGDDRQGLAAAQMELYKKNNINPFGSCLQSLIQLPILIILYYAIREGINSNSPDIYSWMVRPDSVATSFLGLDLLHPDKTYILPVIAAALQFWQMRLVLPKKNPALQASEDPTVKMQANMAYVFPLMTLFVAGNFPAGVALYWIITTAFSVVQQLQVNKVPISISGVEQVVAKADQKHPGYTRSEESVKEIAKDTGTSLEGKVKLDLSVKEEKDSKKGVTVTVRKKSGN